ncbi:hypothetical protein [Sulfurimonas sp.]|uniref:hypothetical protein n=1 Tax=Sulfurimonas sp. TaxID=2022749 RepID=UPI003565D7E1
MKKYLFTVFVLFLAITLSSNELSWVDAQVEAIKPPREGMNISDISNITSPFIFLNAKKSKKRYTRTRSTVKYKKRANNTTATSDAKSIILQQPTKPLVLSAVINDSALINGEWYKLNDSVDSFKLSIVNRTSVVLTKGNGKLVLSTSDTKRSLKFK